MSYRYPPSPLLHAVQKPPGLDIGSDFSIDDAAPRIDNLDNVDIESNTPNEGQQQGIFAKVARGVLYGAVNAVLNIPALIGYASIIFADPFFRPYLPQLVKLVLWSSFVHQCIFTLRSKLPFAIGQVQDAGLIFLSAMTTSVVHIVDGASAGTFPEGSDINSIKATTACCTLAMATTLLGLALMATGALRGAAFVQYLPMPVVSGYLAFIGLFCVEAGLALSTGKDINTDPRSWIHLFSEEAAGYALPAVAAGLILLYVSQEYTHPAALPLAFLLLPAIFYVILVTAQGTHKGEWGMDDATSWGQSNGWLTQPAEGGNQGFFAAFSVFMSPGDIYWPAVFRQFPTWLGMYFVVAFSSCLDVAAIEMDLGTQLDVNHELGKVVGFSNLCSGITGGFTGSYIISLTVFTMRLAPDSRAVGWTCALASLIMCFLPFAATDYVPLFVFGGALIFIGLDLIVVWLIGSVQRLSWRESSLVVGSFVCINAAGLESGLVLGIALTAVAFIFELALGTSVSRVRMASMAHRRPEQRSYLRSHHSQIVQLRLEGHLFFGSALTVLQNVKANIHVPAELSLNPAQIAMEARADEQTRLLHEYTTQAGIPLARMTSMRRVVSYEESTPNFEVLHPPTEPKISPNRRSNPRRTRFVILDFSAVRAVDTTAVRTCFLNLRQQLRLHNVVTIFAGMRPEVQAQFQRCDLLEDTEQFELFEVVDEALEWCEDELLRHAGQRASAGNFKLDPQDKGMSIASVFAELHPEPLSADLFRGIADHFTVMDVEPGKIIYTVGDESTSLYILLSGTVLLQLPELGPGSEEMRTVTGGRVRPGNLFGETDWHVGTPRTYQAQVGSEGAAVAELPKSVQLSDRDRVLLLEVLLSHMSVQLLSADGEM
eukprot:Hpha_TRINITY_DN14152_c0_g1::TRINITY_DN14152_c0_g1_i1::g.10629::m.10629/K03321/TC.SULP; sulfate permease, SulP family